MAKKVPPVEGFCIEKVVLVFLGFMVGFFCGYVTCITIEYHSPHFNKPTFEVVPIRLGYGLLDDMRGTTPMAIKPCICKHPYQDSIHGRGKRVMNKRPPSKYDPRPSYRCTVCKRIH